MKQGIKVFFLGSVLALILSAANAYAQYHGIPPGLDDLSTIDGIVSRDLAGVLRIKINNLESFELKSSKRQTQEDLSHLEDGDHVIGLGRAQVARKLIWLDDLEMVGVKKVLGSWRDVSKRKMFQFHDFTNLSVNESSGPFAGQSLNYRLVPDKKDEWTIFLSSQTSVRIGTMKYNPSNIEIEIIDLSTGKVSEQFRLSPQFKRTERDHSP